METTTDMLLDIRNITVKYGSLVALNEVSLSVRSGEIVGLIGPNGAGKTTLIGVLSGAIVPTAGDVLFRGQSTVGLRPFRIGELGVSRTFQLVQPFQRLTARECVMLGALFGATHGRNTSVKVAREEADRLVEMVGLQHKGGSQSEQLNIPERKKLEMARAMAARPKLLLLDEVMAGLSNDEVTEIVGIIRKLRAEGVAIIVIEHVVQAIRDLADRVVVLHHGKKIADGYVADVLSQDRVVENYLGFAQ